MATFSDDDLHVIAAAQSDLDFAFHLQLQEVLAAADSDLDFASHLQLQEALTASLSHTATSSSSPVEDSVSPSSPPPTKKRGRPPCSIPSDPNPSSGARRRLIATVPEGPMTGLVWAPGVGKKIMDHCTPKYLDVFRQIKFSSHQVVVAPGEDIVSKLMHFNLHGPPRFIHVLWAKGAAINASFCTSSGDCFTYEGRSEIVALEGTLCCPENYNAPIRRGQVSVYFDGPDGEVVGGCALGELVAANQVEVTVLGLWNARDHSASSVPNLLNFVKPVCPASYIYATTK